MSQSKIITESGVVSKSLVAKESGRRLASAIIGPNRRIRPLPITLIALMMTAALPLYGWAQGTGDYFATHFFDATQNSANYSVRIDNPTRSVSPLCAMVYVFDSAQTLQECCGCPLRPDQVETFPLGSLIGNPFGGSPTIGEVDIVASTINHGSSAAANNGCDPAASLNQTPALRSWFSNDNAGVSDGFLGAPLDSQEATKLPALCASNVRLAAPAGICQCGN